MKTIAIIVAGGNGNRAKQSTPKQYAQLGAKPLLAWSVDYFCNDTRFDYVIIVCPIGGIAMAQSIIEPKPNLLFVEGGATRALSVRQGLNLAHTFGPETVFIHDAARPGIEIEIIDRIFAAIENGADGAIPALSIADAIWQIDDKSILKSPLKREDLRRAQTPQAFNFAKLFVAYGNVPNVENAADDAQIAVASGLNVQIIEGSAKLGKVTYGEDFRIMSDLLLPPRAVQIGMGFDAHKFSEGSFLTLCGQVIPHNFGLIGHSDADVAWHAMVDAILGAIGEGDIGNAFPPSDIKWRGAASSIFLEYAAERVQARGGEIKHVDLTIICELPKISPWREHMILNTQKILKIKKENISIKATTTEGMGFAGRKEGIAAQAIATILL